MFTWAVGLCGQLTPTPSGCVHVHVRACVRMCVPRVSSSSSSSLSLSLPGGSSSGKYRKAAGASPSDNRGDGRWPCDPRLAVSCSTVINAFWIGLTRIKEKRRVSCPRICICALMEKCITPDNSESVHTFDFHTYTWQRLIGKRPVRVCALILIYGWHGLETQAAALVAIIPYCRRAFSPP